MAIDYKKNDGSWSYGIFCPNCKTMIDTAN